MCNNANCHPEYLAWDNPEEACVSCPNKVEPQSSFGRAWDAVVDWIDARVLQFLFLLEPTPRSAHRRPERKMRNEDICEALDNHPESNGRPRTLYFKLSYNTPMWILWPLIVGGTIYFWVSEKLNGSEQDPVPDPDWSTKDELLLTTENALDAHLA